MTSWHWLIPFFIVGGAVGLWLWLIDTAGLVKDAAAEALDPVWCPQCRSYVCASEVQR